MSERFDAAWDVYWAEVSRIVLETLRSEVFPLLAERGYTLLSGNGTYYLGDAYGVQLETDPRFVNDDPELHKILCILGEGIPGVSWGSLGTLGYDYPER